MLEFDSATALASVCGSAIGAAAAKVIAKNNAGLNFMFCMLVRLQKNNYTSGEN